MVNDLPLRFIRTLMLTHAMYGISGQPDRGSRRAAWFADRAALKQPKQSQNKGTAGRSVDVRVQA